MSAPWLMTLWPCDRGVPGGVIGRGLHRFEANEHGVACIHCGTTPTPTTKEKDR